MSVRALAAAVLALVAAAGTSAQAQQLAPEHRLPVVVRTSAVADLVHQLDCVGGVIHACGREDYRQLWDAHFLHTAADSAMIAQWRTLRRRYDVSVEVDTTSHDAIGRDYRRVSLTDRWRLAGLQARGFRDYAERLALVLLPQDRVRVTAALAHFRPRFEAWRSREAAERLDSARDSLQQLLEQPALRALLDGIHRFYAAEGTGADTLTLTLVARPGLVRGGTSAEVVDGWAVQELLPGRPLTGEIGVTLHEVAHLLLSLTPMAVRSAIATDLGTSGSEGRAVRSLLDEGLATAFGNGLVQRALTPAEAWQATLDRPLSFYNDPLIDAAGKALLEPLDSLLRAGATLEDAAVVAVLRRELAARLGARLLSPVALLHDMWGFIDQDVEDGREVAAQLQRALRVGNYSISLDSAAAMPKAPLERDPWIGAVVVAPPGSIPILARRGAFTQEQVPDILRAAAAGPALFAATRASGARTWVLVVRSAAEARPLIERMAALEQDREGAVTIR